MFSSCARLPVAASEPAVPADPERPESAEPESADAELAARTRFIHGLSIGPGVSEGTKMDGHEAGAETEAEAAAELFGSF